MALGDVRDFVRQHARQLRFVACGQHQAVVHADEAAGQREGVDGVIAHEEELEPLRGIAGGLGDDARAECLQVFAGFRIVDDLALVAQLPDDLQADAVFVIQRQGRGSRAADVGQVITRLRHCLGRQAEHHHQHGGQQVLRASRVGPSGLAPEFALFQSISEAKSASRERSPRTSVIWPECGQPRKRLTT